jgi:hypothetical protein
MGEKIRGGKNRCAFLNSPFTIHNSPLFFSPQAKKIPPLAKNKKIG